MCHEQEPCRQLKGQGHSGPLNFVNIRFIYSDDGCLCQTHNFDTHGQISK